MIITRAQVKIICDECKKGLTSWHTGHIQYITTQIKVSGLTLDYQLCEDCKEKPILELGVVQEDLRKQKEKGSKKSKIWWKRGLEVLRRFRKRDP